MSRKVIVAVDPGQSGAFALSLIYDGEHVTFLSYNMPEGMTGIVSLVKIIRAFEADSITAYMEKVGGYMPGNSGPASVKFARHCGQLETALFAFEIPCQMVTPHKWMQFLGSMPEDKGDRKRFIKELVQRRIPSVKMTLANADAFGILLYAMNELGVKV